MSESGRPSHREAARGRLPDLEGTLTHDHLRRAFSADARAAVLYRNFARIAEIEGAPEVARTLRELAEQRVLFAEGHLDFLRKAADPITGRKIGGTPQNLRAALVAEEQGETEDLPQYAATAHAEGFPDIASWFESLTLSRGAHRRRIQSAMEQGDPR
jgi:rubrerythrin